MVTATAPLPLAPFRFIEWSAVIAGTILACAITLIFTQFGGALGLSIGALASSNNHLPEQFLGVGLWMLWVQLLSTVCGAYMAGRMRTSWDMGTHESEIRDGAHGLLVWALSTLLVTAGAAVLGYIGSLASAHGAPIDVHPDMHADVSQAFMRKVTIIGGFALAASSIVSGLLGWYMGTVGGDHRDRAPDVSTHYSFRTKRVVAKKR